MKDMKMDIRNKLVKKYFTKEFVSEDDFYNSSMEYRLECLSNGISDSDNIIKYLNRYEIKNILNLVKSSKQTKQYKKWIETVFKNDYFSVNAEEDCFLTNTSFLPWCLIVNFMVLITGALCPSPIMMILFIIVSSLSFHYCIRKIL